MYTDSSGEGAGHELKRMATSGCHGRLPPRPNAASSHCSQDELIKKSSHGFGRSDRCILRLPDPVGSF